MKLAKEKKDLETQSLAYTEIINDLLRDKEDLSIIAREYKQSYEQITICDKDIEYLHRTIKKAIETLSPFFGEDIETDDSLNTFVELINKDTLKTMQLLGFNYKKAIGDPLTEVCSDVIKNKLNSKSSKKRK